MNNSSGIAFSRGHGQGVYKNTFAGPSHFLDDLVDYISLLGSLFTMRTQKVFICNRRYPLKVLNSTAWGRQTLKLLPNFEVQGQVAPSNVKYVIQNLQQVNH